jgi:hypothetical protein
LKDPAAVGPNDTSIKDIMGKLIDGAAEEIRACGNACDAWTKQHLLIKVLSGVFWEEELASFFPKFSKRRKAFEFVLQIRTTTATDTIQLALKNMQEK